MERSPANPVETGSDGSLLGASAIRPEGERHGWLGGRSLVLVGLMGAGKTTVGRRLASRLGLPFKDADAEIELAARMTIPEIFAIYGEGAFRDLERRVIGRLLGDGPFVLATGGGAFMDPSSREIIARTGTSVWLKADHATLMRRVRRRSNRPLLHNPDPEGTMCRLMTERYPVYALADLVIESRDGSQDRVVADIIRELRARSSPSECALRECAS